MGPGGHASLRFVTFVVNVLKAGYTHNALLKAALQRNQRISLGKRQAPPATIISSFLEHNYPKAGGFLEKLATREDFNLYGKRHETDSLPSVIDDNALDRNLSTSAFHRL